MYIQYEEKTFILNLLECSKLNHLVIECYPGPIIRPSKGRPV